MFFDSRRITERRETAIRSIWLPFTELVDRLFDEVWEPDVGRELVDISVNVLGFNKLIQSLFDVSDVID